MYADPGRTLGKYRLIAEIARGGMGIVYLAMVQGPGGFNKLVVVKQLKPDLVEEPAFLQMFLDEAKLAARLNHPNIVQTNEVGDDGNRYFMAMDYLDGRGLDRVRRRMRNAGWGLTLPMQLRVTCDMLAGLDYAHKLTDFDGTPLNIVHRDVSPQNVFLTFDGQVKLLDFGIAKTAESSTETKAGVLKGKVSYMAPEQARGQKVDARADIFSAGVLLWEELTGRKLRQNQSEQEMLSALISGDLPRVSTIKPEIPTEIDGICARAMAPDPIERYQTAEDFQDAIERYLASSNSNVSAREVGLCISDLFKEDRAAINATIESHIARARNESVHDLPIIELSYEPASLSTPIPSLASSSKGSSGTEVPTIDNPAASIVSAAASSQSPNLPVAPPRSASRTYLALAAVGAVAATVVAVIAMRGHGNPGGETGGQIAHPTEPAPRTPASPPPAPAAHVETPAPVVESPPPPAPPASVDVEIRVTPANASVTVDGVNLPANPFHGKYLSDATVHKVHAVAPGFIARTSTITFDANVKLDFSLERAPVVVTRTVPGPARTVPVATPPPPPPPATGSAAPTKPATPNEINPAGGIKPRRPIDSTNPYGGR